MEFPAYADALRAVHECHGRSVLLGPGCDAAALASAEVEIGCGLPAGLSTAWRTCDGSGDAALFMKPGFLTPDRFLSLAAAREARDGLRRRAPSYRGTDEDAAPRDDRIRSGRFQDGWLPFAGFGGGPLLRMIDLSPSAAGRVGQVIAFTHDPDTIDHVASEFATFLRALLATIEQDPEAFLEIF
ncbi:SMI1/KNR4 family protein [Methylorubrum podarium]|uniref:SMI1/KNR4 family protein n=1 Tax=Methylorubrum podarium TaxID=200476 RepID=A0ABV1QI30_9HYPH